MFGKLSMAVLAGAKPLVPGIRRAMVSPSLQVVKRNYVGQVIQSGQGSFSRLAMAVKDANGKIPTEGKIQAIPNSGVVSRIPEGVKRISPPKNYFRRWSNLGDDLVLTPLPSPIVPKPASTGGFWSDLGKGISSAIGGLLPAVAQVKAAQVLTSQQSQLLQQQGQMLYTPANIQTLNAQAQYEAAQRQIELGRATGATSLPLSATTIAIGLGAVGLLMLVMKKK